MLENFNFAEVIAGAAVLAVIGAFVGLFARMRKVETENAQMLEHVKGMEKRLDGVEGEIKSIRGCLLPMKTDLAEIKAMLKTAFNGREDK